MSYMYIRMSVQYVCSVFFLLIYMQFISNLEDEAAFSLHVCHGEDDCVCTYVSARTTATDVCAYWLISLSPLLFFVQLKAPVSTAFC